MHLSGEHREHILKANHPHPAFGPLHLHVANFLYGLEEIHGEYVTTEWVTLLGLPLYPVASWTVHDTTDRWGFTYLSAYEKFEVSRRDERNMHQVLRGYTITVGFFALLFLAPYAMDYFGGKK